ncbi:MAG: enoyl-CoA hydratase/isomerase family protein [Spirochaetales bacterium]|nr:enoyl-CoA hydratase/isomerase family protein [Spirochaetales bacterium]
MAKKTSPALVSIEKDDRGVTCISMHDAAGKNVFSEEFAAQLIAALDELSVRQTPSVVVLKGLPEVFAGGGDKKALVGLAEGNVTTQDLVISEKLVAAPFVAVAAMEGHAVGGGLMIACASDIVLAAEESRYGAVFMSMGFTPGMGCTTLLSELVGPFIANEMMYTAKRFKGRELVGRGTNVNYILPRARVLPKAVDIALQIAEKNPKAVRLLKRALAARKKKLLIDARLQEDLMHELSFSFPETKAIIKEFYVE